MSKIKNVIDVKYDRHTEEFKSKLKDIPGLGIEDLIAVRDYYNSIVETAKVKLDDVEDLISSTDMSVLTSTYGDNPVFVVNDKEEVKLVEKSREVLTYDKDSFENKTLTAPYRVTRDVLDPALIKQAVKDGSLPISLTASITEVKSITINTKKIGGK